MEIKHLPHSPPSCNLMPMISARQAQMFALSVCRPRPRPRPLYPLTPDLGLLIPTLCALFPVPPALSLSRWHFIPPPFNWVSIDFWPATCHNYRCQRWIRWHPNGCHPQKKNWNKCCTSLNQTKDTWYSVSLTKPLEI